jgi:hypothetical protein
MTQRLSQFAVQPAGGEPAPDALIELGIELGAERDPGALIEIGCRVAQNICVSKYACIGVLEPGQRTELLCQLRRRHAGPQIAKAPRAGVLRGLLDQRLPAASTM